MVMRHLCTHSVCTLYALCMHSVYTLYALRMHPVCNPYAPCMQSVCTLYALHMHSVCTPYTLCMHPVCTLYALYMHSVCSCLSLQHNTHVLAMCFKGVISTSITLQAVISFRPAHFNLVTHRLSFCIIIILSRSLVT